MACFGQALQYYAAGKILIRTLHVYPARQRAQRCRVFFAPMTLLESGPSSELLGLITLTH